jgi:hypothetical protein
MALTRTQTLTKTTDCAVFVITNTTIYGGLEEDRDDAAEVLIIAHVTEDGEEEFATVDSTPYLSKVAYNITNELDGHYHGEFLRFPLWVNGNVYYPEILDVNDIITSYANLVYNTATETFYKNILNTNSVEPGVTSDWTTYWEAITDFTESELRTNTTISVSVFNDIHDCRSTVCTKNELYKINCSDGNCADLKNYVPYLKKAVLLAGARSKNADTQSEKAETILRNLENLCPC